MAKLHQALSGDPGGPAVASRNSEPRHVLHVIDRLARGGAERMLVDLANLANADGWRVSVCITRSGGELVCELAPEIELLELGRKQRLDWRAMYRLGIFVRQQRVDILHVHGRSTFSLVALMKVCGLISGPLLLLHDHFSIEMNRSVPIWFKFAGRYLLDHYVGVYQALKLWARSAGIDPERVHVIGNALDLQRLTSAVANPAKPSLPMGSQHPLGITVGGIRPEKGTDILLHALALLPRDLTFTLFIVGGMADPDYAARCRDLCSKLGLDDRIVFLGPRSDVPSLLQTADFAVMPSRSESGPLVLIEYMAFGLPFVSTQVGDVSRKAEQMGVVEFVRPDNPGALASALARLLCLPAEERRRRGEQGREVVRQHFDLRTVMPQWYQLYHASTPAR